jgi:hypothetical protein
MILYDFLVRSDHVCEYQRCRTLLKRSSTSFWQRTAIVLADLKLDLVGGVRKQPYLQKNFFFFTRNE